MGKDTFYSSSCLKQRQFTKKTQTVNYGILWYKDTLI